jgi:DNA end-binding protein Ku
VVPGRGGERAYVVLRQALRDSGKTGVGKVMLRETQHLAALEPMGDALVLTMMRFPSELADLSDFRFPRAAAQHPKEVQMAKALIDQLSAKWAPEKYTDEYEANLLRVIRAKLKGTSPRLKEEWPDARHEKVVDLMERLRQSLAGSRSSPPRSAASRSGASAGSPRAGRVARRGAATTRKGKAQKIA